MPFLSSLFRSQRKRSFDGEPDHKAKRRVHLSLANLAKLGKLGHSSGNGAGSSSLKPELHAPSTTGGGATELTSCTTNLPIYQSFTSRRDDFFALRYQPENSDPNPTLGPDNGESSTSAQHKAPQTSTFTDLSKQDSPSQKNDEPMSPKKPVFDQAVELAKYYQSIIPDYRTMYASSDDGSNNNNNNESTENEPQQRKRHKQEPATHSQPRNAGSETEASPGAPSSSKPTNSSKKRWSHRRRDTPSPPNAVVFRLSPPGSGSSSPSPPSSSFTFLPPLSRTESPFNTAAAPHAEGEVSHAETSTTSPSAAGAFTPSAVNTEVTTPAVASSPALVNNDEDDDAMNLDTPAPAPAPGTPDVPPRNPNRLSQATTYIGQPQKSEVWPMMEVERGRTRFRSPAFLAARASMVAGLEAGVGESSGKGDEGVAAHANDGDGDSNSDTHLQQQSRSTLDQVPAVYPFPSNTDADNAGPDADIDMAGPDVSPDVDMANPDPDANPTLTPETNDIDIDIDVKDIGENDPRINRFLHNGDVSAGLELCQDMLMQQMTAAFASLNHPTASASAPNPSSSGFGFGSGIGTKDRLSVVLLKEAYGGLLKKCREETGTGTGMGDAVPVLEHWVEVLGRLERG